MNIYECIVISLCVIVIGLWGLAYLTGKYNFLEDEKDNAKKAYDDNLKKAKSTGKAGVRTPMMKTDSSLRMPELPKETKKRGRKPTKKGGHLD